MDFFLISGTCVQKNPHHNTVYSGTCGRPYTAVHRFTCKTSSKQHLAPKDGGAGPVPLPDCRTPAHGDPRPGCVYEIDKVDGLVLTGSIWTRMMDMYSCIPVSVYDNVRQGAVCGGDNYQLSPPSTDLAIFRAPLSAL